jgi:phage-related baseplate assembly protein
MSAASNPTIDLSRLPAPQVIAPLDFETIRAALIADFQIRWPDFDTLLESDPAVKLLEVAAYRELNLRGAMNDAARATMLAFAGGSDLEAIGARFGVARLVIAPATETAPAVMEPDADLRRRIQLASERLPWAGMTAGGYIFRALTAAPELKDAALIKRGAGKIDVVLLGRDGDGTVDDPTVAAVYSALAEDDAAQLTDVVTVRAATIVPYSPEIRLRIRRGPDPALVRASAEAAVRAYAADRHKVGLIAYAQQLEAAASVGGVEQAIVDIADVDPGAGGAAWLDTLTITTEIIG